MDISSFGSLFNPISIEHGKDRMVQSSGVGCNVQVAEILNCSELAVPIAETPRRSLIGMWVSRLLWPGTAVLDVGSGRILRDSERPDLFDFQCGGRGQVKYRQGIVHQRLGDLAQLRQLWNSPPNIC